MAPANAISRMNTKLRYAVTSACRGACLNPDTSLGSGIILDSRAFTGNFLKYRLDQAGKLGFEDDHQADQHHHKSSPMSGSPHKH